MIEFIFRRRQELELLFRSKQASNFDQNYSSPQRSSNKKELNAGLNENSTELKFFWREMSRNSSNFRNLFFSFQFFCFFFSFLKKLNDEGAKNVSESMPSFDEF